MKGKGPLRSTDDFFKRSGLKTVGPCTLFDLGEVPELVEPPAQSCSFTDNGFQTFLLFFRTLRERGRSVLHAHLGWNVETGLQTLADALDTIAR